MFESKMLNFLKVRVPNTSLELTHKLAVVITDKELLIECISCNRYIWKQQINLFF